MIKINGFAYMKVPYEITVDMREAEFDSLSDREQDDLLSNTIDWKEVCRSAEVQSFDINDITETE